MERVAYAGFERARLHSCKPAIETLKCMRSTQTTTSGLSCKYEKGDRYWAEWWLAHGHILVDITYNADVGKRDSEMREIQLIVESLRIAGALSPS